MMKIKKIYLFFILSIILGIIVISSSTFAYYSNEDKGGNNTYTAGLLDLEITGNINITNALPMSDEDALGEGGADSNSITITNTGNIRQKFDVYLVANTSNNSINNNYIKLKVDEDDAIDLSGNPIKTGISLEPNESINISIKLWLKNDTPSSEKGKSLSFSVSTKGVSYNDADDCETDIDYDYTGEEDVYNVCKTGMYKIELWGAGGNKNVNSYSSSYPTYGGYVSGNTNLEKGDALYFYVGGLGETFNCCTQQTASGSGGATDVRLVDGNWNDIASLLSRIMVAGGGGATYYDSTGGTGSSAGGLTSYSTSHSYHPTSGSNQTSIGSNGSGGSGGGFGEGAINSQSNYNSGGGGYYGGMSAPSSAGGSSFISGHTGCVAVTSSTSTSPRVGENNTSCTTSTTDNLCSVHYSGKVFTNTVMIDGLGYLWTNVKGSQQQMPNPQGGYYNSGIGHSGNGYARITYIGN